MQDEEAFPDRKGTTVRIERTAIFSKCIYVRCGVVSSDAERGRRGQEGGDGQPRVARLPGSHCAGRWTRLAVCAPGMVQMSPGASEQNEWVTFHFLLT